MNVLRRPWTGHGFQNAGRDHPMRGFIRFVARVLAAVAGLALCVVILLAFLPAVMDLEPIKEMLLAAISENVGGRVEVERVEISMIPRPRAMVHGCRLVVEDAFESTVETLVMYPEVLPLVMGRVRLAKLRLVGPQATVRLREGSGKGWASAEALSWDKVREEISSVVGGLAMKAPGLVLEMERGKITLSAAPGPDLWAWDVGARLRLWQHEIEAEFTCKSTSWERLTLSGRFNGRDGRGKGRVVLTRFQPHGLTEHLFPRARYHLKDSQLDMDLSGWAHGSGMWGGELRASVSSLRVQGAAEEVAFRGPGIRASVVSHETSLRVSLEELNLSQPRLRVTGELLVDRASPHARLRLEGKDLDLASVRQAAVGMVGEVPIVREIFSFLRSGKVPHIALETQGASVEELGRTENLLIRGSLQEAEVFVPGADLQVQEAKGEAVISRGILEGRGLEGRLGGARGRDGKLRVGLEGAADAPLHLDMAVEADLAEAPRYLRRFLRDEALRNEIGRVRQVRGRASGRLILGGRLDSIEAKVEVSSIRASGSYEPIPLLLEIEGGGVLFEGSTIVVQDLRGHVGSSSFSHTTGRLDLDEGAYLEVTSGQGTLELEEIQPWLSSLAWSREALGEVESAQGTLSLSKLEFRGAVSRPEGWQFAIKGELARAAMDTGILPGMLLLSRGSFEATPERVSFHDLVLSFSDASFFASGAVDRYLEGDPRLDLVLEGSAGPVTGQWFWGQAGLPAALKPRAPVSISAARLVWDDQSGSFSGRLGVDRGPEVSGEVFWGPDGVRVEELIIKDGASDASVALHLLGQALDLNFRGKLASSTLDALLEANPFSAGLIQGDVSAHVPLDNPGGMRFTGTLQGEDLSLPWEMKATIRIDRISLSGVGDEMRLELAEVRWGDRVLTMTGKATPSAEGPVVDLSLSSPALGWEEIRTLVAEEEHSSSLPVRGTLRVKSDSFTRGNFVWRPIDALVSFGVDGAKVEVKEAALCGIRTPGSVQFSPDGIAVDFRPIASEQALDVTLGCLGREDLLGTGVYDLKGEIKGKAGSQGVLPSLRGHMEFQAAGGRIIRHALLAKVLAALNVTELLRGKLPDLAAESIPYDTMRAKVEIRDGRMAVKEWVLDGPSVKIAGQGSVDLIARQMDLQLLVSPFRTADNVLGKIPIVRQVTGGSLLAVPVRVAGDLEDPTITPLHPSAVGAGLLGIMKRTIQLPLKLLDPFVPREKEK